MKKINLCLALFILLISCLFSCPNNAARYYDVEFRTFNSDSQSYEQERQVQKVLENTKFSNLITPKINSDITYEDKQYTFVRWSSNPVEDESKPLIEEEITADDEKVIKKDCTLHAVYTAKVKTNATFKAFKNAIYKDISVENVFEGSKFKDVPRLNNVEDIMHGGTLYNFIGWKVYDGEAEDEPIIGQDTIDEDSTIAEDTIYIAVYTLEIKVKLFTYDDIDGKYLSVDSLVEKGTLIKDIEVPTQSVFIGKTEYKFKGWSEEHPVDGLKEDEVIIKGDTPINRNYTLYAVYIRDYLAFTALEDTNIYFNKVGAGALPNPVSFMYQKAEDEDGFKVYTWAGRTSIQSGVANGLSITLKKGEKIYFKGDNITLSYNTNVYIVFGSTAEIEASGNIMSLLNFKTELPTQGYCFVYLFKDCSKLITAPTLPVKTITTSYCYGFMFQDCISLTEAPELPATTLATGCYRGMFQGCISLTEAPELPATTLVDHCYNAMFQGCTSLVKAPKLPATEMKTGCYYYMFKATSITKAPELPATTITNGCYSYMFEDCVSLTEAPELPATTLASNCYDGMFKGCTSLVKAPELPATILGNYCYNAMFQDCVSLTEAPELPATILANYCYNGMFQGCISLTEAPELPATTLAEHCYNAMFEGCSSLTEAPELPATEMKLGSYYYMFKGTSITKAPELPAEILDRGCYAYMFEDCVSLTEAPELPVTTLANGCYRGIFKNCTSLSKGPSVLPAMSVPQYAYCEMFLGTKLVEAPELPAETLGIECYKQMFYCVDTLVKGPSVLPALIVPDSAYMQMFEETSITKCPEILATTLTGSQNMASMFKRTKVKEEAELHLTNTTPNWNKDMYADLREE